MKVDYHMHTLCSDGIYTVKEVIDKALEKNIKSISITDHDTLSGIETARKYSAGKVEYITGIEITCSEYYFEGYELPFSIHMLGYGIDEKNTVLVNLINKRNNQRQSIFQLLLAELSVRGYHLLFSEIPISCGTVLQLCDIINFLKTKYLSIDESVLQFINSYSKDLTNADITIKDAVEAIQKAGGRAVWAHPFIAYHQYKKQGLRKETVEMFLQYLIKCGIAGIEADYLAFTQQEREWLRKLALANNLFFTAGSDFHGLTGREKMGVKVSDFMLFSYLKTNL